MQPPIPPRSRDRVARLRLPDLPPRDLERLAAVTTGPHSAPAPSSQPDSAGYLPPPSATPTKFGGEGSPADVRGYTVTPLLMRGGVVSPGVGGGSGLVLPTLSLPLTSSALPPASHLTLPNTTNLNSAISPTNVISSSHQHNHHNNNHHHHHQQQQQQHHHQQQQQQHYTTSTSHHYAHHHPPPHMSKQLHSSGNGATPSSLSAALSSAVNGGMSSGGACKSPPPPASSNSVVTGRGMGVGSGARTTPSSPVAGCGLTQNEIKKAQNRKSAKRFREAQKQRWKNMADDLMSHKRTIDELRAQLAAQANHVAHTNNALRAAQHQYQHQATGPSTSLGCMINGGVAAGGSLDGKRSVVSINDLVDLDGLSNGAGAANVGGVGGGAAVASTSAHTHAEAEAALYAQILSSKANGLSGYSVSKHKMEDIGGGGGGGGGSGSDGGSGSGSGRHGGEPYAKELGVLNVCVVVEKSSGRVVSVRRGSPNGVGTCPTDGLNGEIGSEYRNGLLCDKAVAITFTRNGCRVNAVMNPVDGCDRVVVAEFTPL